jgi:hypothetical protein
VCFQTTKHTWSDFLAVVVMKSSVFILEMSLSKMLKYFETNWIYDEFFFPKLEVRSGTMNNGYVIFRGNFKCLADWLLNLLLVLASTRDSWSYLSVCSGNLHSQGLHKHLELKGAATTPLVWQPDCVLDNWGIEVRFPIGERYFFFSRASELALGPS